MNTAYGVIPQHKVHNIIRCATGRTNIVSWRVGLGACNRFRVLNGQVSFNKKRLAPSTQAAQLHQTIQLYTANFRTFRINNFSRSVRITGSHFKKFNGVIDILTECRDSKTITIGEKPISADI